MNILYHHRTQGTGAEGNHIREVVKALRSLGHQVDIISPPGVDPMLEPVEKGPSQGRSTAGLALKAMARALPQVCFECAEIAYNRYSAQKIVAYAGSSKPDLIYERYAFFCRVPSRISKKLGIPHILEVNEISGIKRQRGQTMVKLCTAYEKEIFENVSSIVVVSDFLKNEIVNRGIDARKIAVIPNAINPLEFDHRIDGTGLRKALGLDGKTVITFVGIFVAWDRLQQLLRAFSEVKNRCSNAHLVLVGDGAERQSLMRQAQNLGLEHNVTFTGRVPRADVPRYIGVADICVLFGSNPFGSPMALFEYLAMGKPVVVPDYSPITAVIENGREGFIFPPDKEGAFVDRLTELISDSKLRQAMSTAARARMDGQFTWEGNARKIVQLYEGIKNART